MATLEKIRKRSVLLLIVIAVALLAFILGDAITNSRNLFGSGTTVAKIGGEKIEIQEFQNRREQLNQQLEEARKNNPQSVANVDVQTLPQMALDQLIADKLFTKAVNKMGIRTSSDVLRFFMLESPQMLPELQNVVAGLQQLNVNVTNAQQAYDVIFRPQGYNLTQSQVEPYQRQWLAAEKKYSSEIAKMTYTNLLQRTFKANDLDKKALYNDYVATASVSVAFQPYGEIDEKKNPVTDAELRKAYEAEKSRFMVEEPTKDVEFIAVNVTPSNADRAAAAKLATRAAVELRAGSLSKELKKEGLNPEKHELRGADLPAGPLKEFVLSAPADSVKIVSNNAQGFAVVKMKRRFQAVDSINVVTVQVLGSKLPSTVLARLNAGLSPDSIAKVFPSDSVMAAPAQWIPLYTAEGKTQIGLQPAQLDSLINNAGRFITLDSQKEGAVLASVVKKTAPVEIYEYEEINYAIQPSAKTLEVARVKLEKFLAANNTPAKFKANAQKAGYNVQNFQLTQSSPAVPRFQGYNMYYPDSRQVVRWVMIDGEPGQVSHVYESKDAAAPMLYAAAVVSEYEDYVPMSNEDVKQYLSAKVRVQKLGDKRVAEYSKLKSIADVARKMGVEVREIADFRFSRNPGASDLAVVGKVMGSKPGAKMMVVRGEDGVYAFVIKSNGKESFAYDDANFEQQFMRMINPDMTKMLRGNSKLVNTSYKFEAGD